MQHLEISANTINAFNKIDEDWLYCVMFDNTCDKYEGIWDSCYLFNGYLCYLFSLNPNNPIPIIYYVLQIRYKTLSLH